MNIKLLKGWVRALGMGCAVMAAPHANAVQKSLTAEFTPSLDNPANNTFTNTTTAGPICQGNPRFCDYRKSVYFNLRLDSQTPFLANDPNPRQGLSIKLPADWKQTTVRHTVTGETRVVEMRFDAIAAIFKPTPSSTAITGISDKRAAHAALWRGGSLEVAPAPCISKAYDIMGTDEALFMWDTPVATACTRQVAFDIEQVNFNTIELLYQMRTPTPLDMAAGMWAGDISYSFGPGGDFDFGDNLIANATNLDVIFALTVEHHLRVVFPPGADRLALEPEGGWMPWISRGRRPERIVRDQPFQFTTSGPVKMRIDCQYLLAGNCAISNARGHSVPVETRITLPAGMQALDGGPISKALLTTVDDLNAVAANYVADATGTLHFEVKKADVEAMLGYQDTTYSGNVTVVWDSYLIP